MEDHVDPQEVNDSDDLVMADMGNQGTPRPVRVLDLIDPSVPRADAATRRSRMDACRACEHLRAGTVCGQCNCVMKFKSWLAPATCPVGKWSAA